MTRDVLRKHVKPPQDTVEVIEKKVRANSEVAYYTSEIQRWLDRNVKSEMAAA